MKLDKMDIWFIASLVVMIFCPPIVGYVLGLLLDIPFVVMCIFAYSAIGFSIIGLWWLKAVNS